jgi:hypothetical protein
MASNPTRRDSHHACRRAKRGRRNGVRAVDDDEETFLAASGFVVIRPGRYLRGAAQVMCLMKCSQGGDGMSRRRRRLRVRVAPGATPSARSGSRLWVVEHRRRQRGLPWSALRRRPGGGDEQHPHVIVLLSLVVASRSARTTASLSASSLPPGISRQCLPLTSERFSRRGSVAKGGARWQRGAVTGMGSIETDHRRTRNRRRWTLATTRIVDRGAAALPLRFYFFNLPMIFFANVARHLFH